MMFDTMAEDVVIGAMGNLPRSCIVQQHRNR